VGVLIKFPFEFKGTPKAEGTDTPKVKPATGESAGKVIFEYAEGLEEYKAAVEKHGVAALHSETFDEDITISLVADMTIGGAMQVDPSAPTTIKVNTRNIGYAEWGSAEIASTVGHEVIHVKEIKMRLAAGLPVTDRFRWQSENNATQWQRDNKSHFGLKYKSDYMEWVRDYQKIALKCQMNLNADGC